MKDLAILLMITLCLSRSHQVSLTGRASAATPRKITVGVSMDIGTYM